MQVGKAADIFKYSEYKVHQKSEWIMYGCQAEVLCLACITLCAIPHTSHVPAVLMPPTHLTASGI